MPGGGDGDHGDGHDHMHETPTGDRLGVRFAVAAFLSVPVVLLSMVGALHFDEWEWVALALTLPLVLWAGWPFHRATILKAATARRPWTPC